MQGLLDSSIVNQVPFGAFMGGTTDNLMSGIATRSASMSNKLGAAGRSMIQHAKPLALGTAAALGMAALLSDPPRVVAPGANSPPSANMAGGTGGSRVGTDIHPQSHMTGAPTAPPPQGFANTSRIAQKTSGYDVQIKGVTGAGISPGSLNEQMRQATRGRARITSNIQDRRSKLTAQKLSSILQDD
jgi:hypothetical protein